MSCPWLTLMEGMEECDESTSCFSYAHLLVSLRGSWNVRKETKAV